MVPMRRCDRKNAVYGDSVRHGVGVGGGRIKQKCKVGKNNAGYAVASTGV
eukprot:COSAG05_NODE_23025_length_261_cov_0.456790_2_plen_49_part_01